MLFNNTTASNNHTRLLGSERLTVTAESMAATLLSKIESEEDVYEALIPSFYTDNSVLDAHLADIDLSAFNTDDIIDFDIDTVGKMLKSQQSKRSRSKSKDKTRFNFNALLTAAYAEHLLRDIYNIERSTTTKGKSVMTLTDEDIVELANDQGALVAAIKNVQSRKCTLKKSDDFDEESEGYEAILLLESKLKAQRIAGARTSYQAQAVVYNEINAIVGDIDVDSLKVAEAKELLKAIQFKLDTKDQQAV